LTVNGDELRPLPLHLRPNLESPFDLRPHGIFQPVRHANLGPGCFAARRMVFLKTWHQTPEATYVGDQCKHRTKVKNRTHPAME
jgi:hypothetical protein